MSARKARSACRNCAAQACAHRLRYPDDGKPGAGHRAGGPEAEGQGPRRRRGLPAHDRGEAPLHRHLSRCGGPGREKRCRAGRPTRCRPPDNPTLRKAVGPADTGADCGGPGAVSARRHQRRSQRRRGRISPAPDARGRPGVGCRQSSVLGNRAGRLRRPGGAEPDDRGVAVRNLGAGADGSGAGGLAQAGAWELHGRTETPARVVIAEYVDVARSFSTIANRHS